MPENSYHKLVNKEYKEIKTHIKGRQYQYYDIGNGDQAIIFLHGLAASKEGEPQFYDRLLSKYRCIFIDLPAHNNLPCYDFDCLNDFYRYVIELISYLKLTNIAIVGFSFGGLVAISVGKKLRVPAVAWATPIRTNGKLFSEKALIAFNWAAALPKPAYTKIAAMLAKPTSLFDKLGIKLSKQDYKALLLFDNSKAKIFKNIVEKNVTPSKNTPILFIFGTNDPLVRSTTYKELQLTSKVHKKVLIKNGGHFGTNTGRIEALNEIEKFLAP